MEAMNLQMMNNNLNSRLAQIEHILKGGPGSGNPAIEYDPNQVRDDHRRWTSSGSGGKGESGCLVRGLCVLPER